MSNQRAVLLLVNASREEAKGAAETISKILVAAGIKIYTPADSDIPHVEVVLVLGGDGTILRGAEFALKENVPLLGINLGHVGFMAEVEAFTFEKVAQAVIDKDYVLDPRMLLTFQVKRGKNIIDQGWHLMKSALKEKARRWLNFLFKLMTDHYRDGVVTGLFVQLPLVPQLMHFLQVGQFCGLKSKRWSYCQ